MDCENRRPPICSNSILTRACKINSPYVITIPHFNLGVVMNITIEQLKAVLQYNPETGEILRAPHWKPVSLTAKGNNYQCVEVAGRRYSARRLVWALMTDEWPPDDPHSVRIRDERLGLRWSNLYLNGTERVCQRCSMSLPIDEFHVRSKTKTGKQLYASYCKTCAYQTKEKDYAHKTKCKKYGLTPEQYAQMLEQQEGSCAICGEAPTGKRLAIDHCHTTGEVRGLLCSTCNTGLGSFKDSTDLLHSAVKYLRR